MHAHPGGFVKYKKMIDTLNIDEFIWTPYTDHIVDRWDDEFDGAILFSSYLCWERLMARHLSERCLRNYGYVWGILQPNHVIPSEGIDNWFRGNIVSSARAIRDRAVEV